MTIPGTVCGVGRTLYKALMTDPCTLPDVETF